VPGRESTKVTNVESVFCCIRPPGHHAGRYGSTTGCTQNGFCLLNNVAIGVYYARAKYGIERIAIVDIDAHFGNGTLDIFQHDSNVFYASIHLESDSDNDPFFPSSSYVNQGVETNNSNCVLVNIKPTKRFGMNLPRQQQANAGKPGGVSRLRGRAGYLHALSKLVIPGLKKFQPELLFISAGFDGSMTDPIGGALGLTAMDYYNITRELRLAVQELGSQGKAGKVRIISVLEGGYDVGAGDGLSTCVEAHVRGLCDEIDR
jgi:acetoin utilization deacetylase AcuC-like enzyme